jgi:hypothetical protein
MASTGAAVYMGGLGSLVAGRSPGAVLAADSFQGDLFIAPPATGAASDRGGAAVAHGGSGWGGSAAPGRSGVSGVGGASGVGGVSGVGGMSGLGGVAGAEGGPGLPDAARATPASGAAGASSSAGTRPVGAAGAAPAGAPGAPAASGARAASGAPAAESATSEPTADPPTPSGAPAPGLPAPATPLPGLPASPPVRQVDAVVTLPGSITAKEVRSLTHTPGLAAVEEVDTGTVTLAGSPAFTMGVDAATYREFTPAVTAEDGRLWQYVAAGALASSYQMATDRKLALGSRLPIEAARPGLPPTSGWLGAYVTLGMPGVDLVVGNRYSRALGLTPDSGLVVSAPGMGGAQLRQALAGELPGASIDVVSPNLTPVPVPPSSHFVTSSVMSTVVAAALSRVGDPYVWGGDGPNDFDCSGLVGWAFAQAGIGLPRTAAQQYLTGPRVPLSQLQPGDLLFWAYDPAEPGYVDHVAMYIGHGQMVVAPHTGTDVQVDPVYTADLVGAVRVDPGMAEQVGGPQFP